MASQEIAMPERIHFSHRTIAHYLELAYMNVENEAEVATQIRQKAHDARTELTKSCGLMKKVEATAQHVISTMLELIKDGIEFNDKELIKKAIQMTIRHVRETMAEAVKTKERNEAFIESIETLVGDSLKDSETIKKRIELLDTEIAKQKEIITNANKELVDAMENRKTHKEEKEKSISKSESLFEKTAAGGQTEIDNLNSPTLLDTAVCATMLAGSWFIGMPALGVLGSSAYLAKKGHEAPDKTRHASKNIAEQLEALRVSSERSLHEFNEKQPQLDKEVYSARTKETNEKIKEKHLDIEKTDLNKKQQCLEKALEYTKMMDVQYTCMTMFWQNMEVMLCTFMADIEGKSLYASLQNAVYKKRLLDACVKAETDWKKVLVACQEFGKGSLIELNKNYKFLTLNYTRMSKQDKEKRETELKKSIDASVAVLNQQAITYK